MKKWAIGLVMIILGIFLITGCGNLDKNNGEKKHGSIQVGFYIDTLNAQQINHDFSEVNSGKVFLKQGGVVKYQSNLTIDKVNKTGQCIISDINIGDYVVAVELSDANSHVLYVGQGTVTIIEGNNGVVNINLTKNIARLMISGSWTGDTSGLTSALVQLKKNGIVIYGGNLELNEANKTVSGGIDNIMPDTYEIYVEIRNGSSMALFTGSQSKTIVAGDNSVTIDLIFKTGGIEIRFNGDLTAPRILVGPNVFVNGHDVTITWATDEEATSNICYSTVSGFDYQSQTDWAPAGRDLVADNTYHNVQITNLAYNTYCFVVVSTDISGNTVVSDEKSFVTGLTATSTSTLTQSPTPAPTLAQTSIPTPAQSSTPALTPTPTLAQTLTPTPAQSPTPTPTRTPTLTLTPTPSALTPTPTSSSQRRIVFYSTRDGNNEIYVMDLDGGHPTRLTYNDASDLAPDFSPDRSKIVFQSNRDGFWAIYRINVDGTDLQRITTDSTGVTSPVWSPDGSKVVVCKKTGLCIINPDGSNPVTIPNSCDGNLAPNCPDWSPDGNKIVFTFLNSHLYVINIDGSGLTCLTNSVSDFNPSWSVTGKIAFTSMRDGYNSIYIMNTDGSNQTRLTNNSFSNMSPCWSPGGGSFAFCSNRDGNNGIYTMNPDGSNLTRLSDLKDFSPSWR